MNEFPRWGGILLKAKTVADYLFFVALALVGMKMVTSGNVYFGSALLIFSVIFTVVVARGSELGLRFLGCFYLIGALVVVLFLFPMPDDRSNYSLGQQWSIAFLSVVLFILGAFSLMQKTSDRLRGSEGT